MLKNVLYIALGGAAGSVLRYLIQTGIHRNYPGLFPYGTFAVNGIGCFVAGLLLGWIASEKLPGTSLGMMLVAGFCGGFTTFSAFAYESNDLLMENKAGQALFYLVLSITAGMALAYIGYKWGKG